MSDGFFDFGTEFPPGLNVLGRHAIKEELLTDDVEEEYDALNDETFGHAANDDWEEAHEKLSELHSDIKPNHTLFDDSLFDGDESQNEILSKSLRHLGLEDDLDDPAIMTVGRTRRQPSSRLDSVFCSSPPPPVILDTEICGSPKTHSIWSTTAKDSGISSLLHSHSDAASLHKDTSSSSCFGSDSSDAFGTPLRTAWTLEELEKDLLSSEKEKSRTPTSSSWPDHFPVVKSSSKPDEKPRVPVIPNNQQNASPLSDHNLIQRLKEITSIKPPNTFGASNLRSNILSPIGTIGSPNLSGPLQSSPVMPLRPGRATAMTVGNQHMSNGPHMPFLPFTNLKLPINPPVMNNMHPNNLRGAPMPNVRHGFGFPWPNMMPLNQQLRGYPPPRNMDQLMMRNSRPLPYMPVFPVKGQEMDLYRNNFQNNEDEYAGLMTQKEKEWLIRIQLLLLKTENPYVEDYYYTTQIARRCMKNFTENAQNGGGDGPQLVLPERNKTESKTYVPTQFEGSLGKLQAVSVNFPRKVLDVGVSRPLEDEEGKIVTNQCLMKYRRLLLDIEKSYTILLEIDDEERRILALPDTAEEPHKIKILKLTNKLFADLACETVGSDDTFQNIMTIRKGRNLVIRAFKLFNKDQQLQCLCAICRCLPMVLKKDKNDLVLLQNCKMFISTIKKCSLPDLVQLGESLENIPQSGVASPVTKDQNYFISAFKSKFGSSVICTMFEQAEELYSVFCETDIKDRWSRIALVAVNALCNLSDLSISPTIMPRPDLLSHFERFITDSSQLEVLKAKLDLLEPNLKVRDGQA